MEFMLTHQTTSATAVAGKARVAPDHTGKTDYDRFVFCLNLLGKRFIHLVEQMTANIHPI